jgi:glycerophosphoryl diester phosphodiesterase
MKIISHRGGAGLGLENTASAIKATLTYDVDGIEIDIRYSKDGHAVLVHDHTTARISDTVLNVRGSTLKELKAITLKNGEKILTLHEALKLIDGRLPVLLDFKDSSTVRALLQLLDKFPNNTFVLTGLMYEFIKIVADERGHTEFLVQSHFSSFEIVQEAQRLGASGITLNAWLLNPLTYRMTRRNGIKLYVYTVNSNYVMWFIRKFYKGGIWVSTDVPQKFVNKKEKK